MILHELDVSGKPEGLFDNPLVMSTYQELRKDALEVEKIRAITERIEKAGPIMVVDPEKAYYDLPATLEKVKIASRNGMSVMELGGSTDLNHEAEVVIPEIRKAVDDVGGNTLLISFPGTSSQVVEGVDATFSLFLPQLDEVFRHNSQIAEVLNGEYLRIIDRSRQIDVPIIPVTYILFNAGNKTSVEKATGIGAINVRERVDIAEIMMTVSPWLDSGDLVMLEMGSGPNKSVNLGPVAKEVFGITGVRPIVTGGISSPQLMMGVTEYLETPVVFGSVAEFTPPDEFEALYKRFKSSHPSTR